MKSSLIALIILCAVGSCKQPDQDPILLNDLQIIGSHNSYKVAIEPAILDYITSIDSAEGLSLEYEHISITDQLDLGLRNLELDLFYDPAGGYYSDPAGLDIVRATGAAPQPFDIERQLSKPGLKVFHIQEIDFRSHQLLFLEALQEIKIWSEAHPNHSPIIITINAKDHEVPNTRKPITFNRVALRTIDSEILQAFDTQDLITPDMIRGIYPSLEEAVLTEGWPSVEAVQGRLMFVLDELDPKRGRYLSVYPGLKGAVMFINQEAGNPEAAFMIINNPIKDFDLIRSMVDQGYMVRTRADAGTMEARHEDYKRFEMAKKSGAQVITTDYYQPSRLFESSFQIRFNDGSYERAKLRR